jgi:succinate dehydrogenase / fumarate reductase membrane anchor subunit
MTTIDAPRSPRMTRSTRRTTRGSFEMAAWLFMRISGVVLVVLVFGHLFVNLVAGEGISGINFGFVAGKWADIRWQIWDLLMLWLGMIHGANGMRTIINDYAEKDRSRLVLKALLLTAFTLTVVLGTLVIFTFDPCPAGSPAELLPSFCTA